MNEPRKWYDPFYRETADGRYVVYPWGLGTRGYEIRDPGRIDRIRGFNLTAYKVLLAGTVAVTTLFLMLRNLRSPLALPLLYALFVIPAGVVYVVGLRRLLAGTPRTEKLHYSEFVPMQGNIFGTKVLYLTGAVDVALLIFGSSSI